MKTIGLVGGMTPESTAIYYQQLIRSSRQPGADPLRNPEIVIYSLDLAEVVALQRTREFGRVAEILASILERLRIAGAEVGALTANTPHAYLDDIRAQTALPIISIVTATCAAAAERGIRRALLLGTSTTLGSGMYPREFGEAGIEVVLPGPTDREFLDETIYNELALGRVEPEVRQRYVDLCTTHIERDGVDAVILGCTEIPLVIKDGDLPVQILDSTIEHVAEILSAAR